MNMEKLPNGYSFRVKEYKYHVVLSFSDDNETYYVVKYFGRYKQWWHYEIWPDCDSRIEKQAELYNKKQITLKDVIRDAKHNEDSWRDS